MPQPEDPREHRAPAAEQPPTGALTRRATIVGLAATAVAAAVPGAASAAPARDTAAPAAVDPDFGPNVVIFDPSMPRQQIQDRLNAAFTAQETAQFGPGRYAFLFKPGHYQDIDVNVGYYTHIVGLGRQPDDVNITGWVRVIADWFGGNATQNFWRGAENLSVTPWDGVNRWAVSQAAPMRRVHVRGELPLWNGYDGWSSGGFMADCQVDRVVSGSQQQWFTRNSRLGEWAGSVWNMVFLGVEGAPPNHFPNPSHTTIDRTPYVREKPYLYVDGAGAFHVFRPEARRDSRGISWANGPTPGTSIPIGDFHIVRPGDSAASMNAALAQGRHLLITPGVYHLNQTLEVTRPDTIVLGMGLATLIPDNGITAIRVADVDGVQLAHLLVDAGPQESGTLVEIGPAGSSARHEGNPIHVHDVFARIGGAGAGRALRSLVVNSHDTIVDHVWLWRGDHGDGIGWEVNPAEHGLIVNGDNVTIYGLFAEHYRREQVIWNGERGRTYFFQCELPYDPPSQAAYMNGGERGFPAYLVADSVTDHRAWGLGVYCLFLEDASIVSERAIQAPRRSGVAFQHMVIVSLGQLGTINRVINDTGGPAGPGLNDGIYYLVSYP
ncbi:adenylyl cyclase [Allonocardiopsis opalescens]|uniref:Pectate lyase-like protein n=1 Tax=Allonocardiopsis opalescens TaxID=1144618 RepID=A0A2T0PYZ6_9ACTN|nr:adenylyl cyclase [Allonocardiopsis opalescens]PRX96742.1 hypothetical protein CLV72_107265 [Allonocardiopsis opalescens]